MTIVSEKVLGTTVSNLSYQHPLSFNKIFTSSTNRARNNVQHFQIQRLQRELFKQTLLDISCRFHFPNSFITTA